MRAKKVDLMLEDGGSEEEAIWLCNPPTTPSVRLLKMVMIRTR